VHEIRTHVSWNSPELALARLCQCTNVLHFDLDGMPFVAWRICKVGRLERDIAAWKDESMQTTGFAEILTLIEQLSPEEKRQLIEYVARDLQRTPSASVRLSWQDARGLGKDIWAGVDTDQYIDMLRQEWDR
jgi:hypothetical protein